MNAKELARLKRLDTRREDFPPEEVWRPQPVARKLLEAALARDAPGKAARREFEAQIREAGATAEELATKNRKAATTASRKRSGQVKSMVRARAVALQKLGGFGNLTSQTPRFLLQTPFEVSLAGASVTERQVSTGKSFVRFAKSAGRGSQGVVRTNFSYVWENPTDKYVLINVHGYVVLDGYIELGVNGGVFPADRRARIGVDAFMEVLDWGPEPTMPMAVSLTQTAASLYEVDDGFWAVGAIAWTDVFRGFDLDTALYIVRPHGTVGFVVAARVSYSTGANGGRVEADFQSGGHRVISPGILIQIVS